MARCGCDLPYPYHDDDCTTAERGCACGPHPLCKCGGVVVTRIEGAAISWADIVVHVAPPRTPEELAQAERDACSLLDIADYGNTETVPAAPPRACKADVPAISWADIEIKIAADGPRSEAIRVPPDAWAKYAKTPVRRSLGTVEYTIEASSFDVDLDDGVQRKPTRRTFEDMIANQTARPTRNEYRPREAARVVTGYLRPVFDPNTLRALITHATPVVLELAKRYNFDALVCRGVSGLAYAAPLSVSTGLPLAVVRKNDGESSHSGLSVEGWIGDDVRYAFVDDFISSGNTFEKCVAAVSPASVVVALVAHYNTDFESSVGRYSETPTPVHGIAHANL